MSVQDHEHFGPADAALLATRAGTRATWISLGGLALTAAIQLVVAMLSGSVALFADTIHNLTDALTAIPLLIAFRLARKPPSRRYPYGYHRAEDVAGLVIVALIFGSAVVAGIEAVQRLICIRRASPQPGWCWSPGSWASSATKPWLPIASGSVAGSVRRPWWRTVCTPGPMGSRRSG